MPSTRIVALLIVFITGAVAGGIAVGYFLKAKPDASSPPTSYSTTNLVQSESVSPSTSPIVTQATTYASQQQAPNTKPTKGAISEKWAPQPGDDVLISFPEQVSVGSGPETAVYVIPTSVASFARYFKYLTARDGAGVISLAHKKQAVWSPKSKLRARIIDINKDAMIAEVRIKEEVYSAKYDSGNLNHEEGQLVDNIEAVVPVQWLTQVK
jgi:hypothetical protein